jgi:hypothetical protein
VVGRLESLLLWTMMVMTVLILGREKLNLANGDERVGMREGVDVIAGASRTKAGVPSASKRAIQGPMEVRASPSTPSTH